MKKSKLGNAMTDEARITSRTADLQNMQNIGTMLKSIRSRFASLGDVNLSQPSREPMREQSSSSSRKMRKPTS